MVSASSSSVRDCIHDKSMVQSSPEASGMRALAYGAEEVLLVVIGRQARLELLHYK
jgi:hypothetical protein